MAERPRKSGFTLVELLTTVSIIAILVGILIPSLNLVRTIARETKQKAQFVTIELALTAFRNDYGDYPPSVYPTPPGDYCGAQKLAEALLGWDLMGFHPHSDWIGSYASPETNPYDLERDENTDRFPDTLTERKGPYLEPTNAFRLGNSLPTANDGLFADPTPLAANTYVLCDSFGIRRLTIGGKPVKAGSPILYYRATTSGRRIIDIYVHSDNLAMYDLGPLRRDGTREPAPPAGREHPLRSRDNFYSEKCIVNPKIPSGPWPYRPDTYILISAGPDGLYGTNDDIRNFGN